MIDEFRIDSEPEETAIQFWVDQVAGELFDSPRADVYIAILIPIIWPILVVLHLVCGNSWMPNNLRSIVEEVMGPLDD